MALSVAHGIPDEFRTEFFTVLDHEIQQVQSKFSDRVRIVDVNGKEKTFGSLEASEFTRRSGRLEKSAPTEAEIHSRKLSKAEWDDQRIFDKSDDEFLGELKLPDGEVISGMRKAYARLFDTEVCKAASATVYGGDDGVDAITMPSSQQVAVGYGTYTGMSPSKLVRAMEIFESNDFDHMETEIYLAMTPAEKRQLHEYIKAAPNDTYADMVAAWIKGTEKKLFGFTPILTNRVERDDNNVGTCFAYVAKEGIYASAGDLDIKMDIIPTQKHALMISAYAKLGFMRRQEKAIVQIYCDSDATTVS